MLLYAFIIIMCCIHGPAAQCTSSETNELENNIIGPYVSGTLLGTLGGTQDSCANIDTMDCNDFSAMIDEVEATGADGQCLLDAYDFFNAQCDVWSITGCQFDDLVSTCPDATTLNYAVDGGYSEWSSWSCDCDIGTETRTRTCDNPTPVNDGFTCTEQSLGDATETGEACDDNCADSEESENAAPGMVWNPIILFALVICRKLVTV